MPTIAHSTLTTTELHEPKGVDTALEGKVYVADGAGSGTWHYLPTGWEFHKDNAAAQTFNTTTSQLSIDGLGSSSTNTYAPFAIRGTSNNLWDTTTDSITPIQEGDAYDLRLDLPVTGKTGSPTELTLELDIGGTGSPTIVIVERVITTSKTPPYTVSVAFPVFCGSTFVANGGDIFLTADTGSVEITAPGIYLGMNTSGAIV